MTYSKSMEIAIGILLGSVLGKDAPKQMDKQMLYLTNDKLSVYHLLGHLDPYGTTFIDCRGKRIFLADPGDVVPSLDFKIEKTNASCPVRGDFTKAPPTAPE